SPVSATPCCKPEHRSVFTNPIGCWKAFMAKHRSPGRCTCALLPRSCVCERAFLLVLGFNLNQNTTVAWYHTYFKGLPQRAWKLNQDEEYTDYEVDFLRDVLEIKSHS